MPLTIDSIFIILNFVINMAAVAELVDAHDSNSCGGDSVRVRFPLAAQ